VRAVQNLVSLNETQASQPAYLNQAAWRQMQEATSFEVFAQAWLALQCSLIGGVRLAVVVSGEPDEGPYRPIAFWPEGKPGNLAVISAADLAIEERRGVLRDPSYSAGELERSPSAPCHIAYPHLVDGRLHGAVAIELSLGADQELRAAMRALQWGVSWLEVKLRRAEGGRFAPVNRRLASLLELVSVSLEKERLQAAATAVVTDIATSLGCERVSFGVVSGQHIKVTAMSHSAHVGQRSNLIEGIGAVMDEAADQRSTLVYPAPADSPVRLLYNHVRLAKAHDCTLCTVPLSVQGKVIGALALQRPGESGFDVQTVEFCEAIGAIVGPILAIRQRDERWIVGKLAIAVKALGVRVFGRGHWRLKMALSSIAGIALFLTLATGQYRVSADTRVEGSVQRVVVAPMSGYMAVARVRSGDIVRKDDLIAQLDHRDLLLERAKWSSQRQQRLQEYRDALAKSNRADIAIVQAQLGQAEAELALVEEKLARTRLLAPFDGVIVSGDLSQSLGAPVTQGDVLFKVAPLDAYRVILEIDERDMAEVRVGATGQLVLTGQAEAVLPFRVEKITLVSETREGRNFFRVEAKLDRSPKFLRPGMKGVGKIDIGERKLGWIWTHSMVDWLRLAWWTHFW
jgi:multidrug resistance efflux pump